jgi:hypothetical protein
MHRRLIPLLLAACALASAPARASTPDLVPAGADAPGAAWEEAFTGRVPHPPGTCTRLGGGDVILIHPDDALHATCAIAPRDRLLVAFGSSCASWEGFRGPLAQRRCAIDSDQALEHFPVSVDGHGQDIRQPGFEFLTGWRWLWLPAGNPLGLRPQLGTFTAHGWSAYVRGLNRGTHAVAYVIDAPDWGGPFTATVAVEVR